MMSREQDDGRRRVQAPRHRPRTARQEPTSRQAHHARQGRRPEDAQGTKALSKVEIDLVRKWIAEGAMDDYPQSTRSRSSNPEHPPVYTRPPVIPALDFSARRRDARDRRLPRGPALQGRRLRSGSPAWSACRSASSRSGSRRTGSQLAAVGGLPARTGEVQIWELREEDARASVPSTYDTSTA